MEGPMQLSQQVRLLSEVFFDLKQKTCRSIKVYQVCLRCVAVIRLRRPDVSIGSRAWLSSDHQSTKTSPLREKDWGTIEAIFMCCTYRIEPRIVFIPRQNLILKEYACHYCLSWSNVRCLIMTEKRRSVSDDEFISTLFNDNGRATATGWRSSGLIYTNALFRSTRVTPGKYNYTAFVVLQQQHEFRRPCSFLDTISWGHPHL